MCFHQNEQVSHFLCLINTAFDMLGFSPQGEQLLQIIDSFSDMTNCEIHLTVIKAESCTLYFCVGKYVRLDG